MYLLSLHTHAHNLYYSYQHPPPEWYLCYISIVTNLKKILQIFSMMYNVPNDLSFHLSLFCTQPSLQTYKLPAILRIFDGLSITICFYNVNFVSFIHLVNSHLSKYLIQLVNKYLLTTYSVPSMALTQGLSVYKKIGSTRYTHTHSKIVILTFQCGRQKTENREKIIT